MLGGGLTVLKDLPQQILLPFNIFNSGTFSSRFPVSVEFENQEEDLIWHTAASDLTSSVNLWRHSRQDGYQDEFDTEWVETFHRWCKREEVEGSSGGSRKNKQTKLLPLRTKAVECHHPLILPLTLKLLTK